MSQHSDAAPHTRGHVIRWARAYDILTSLIGAGPRSATRQWMIDSADLRSGDRVLDVGCGPGALTLLADERVGATGEVHGIDPSPEMIKLASERAAKSRSTAKFRIGVIEELPFPDATFDAVLSSFMLHHLPDDLKRGGFREIYRVLKPGGTFLAVDLSGKGFFWKVLALAGHRLPPAYAENLGGMMREAGLVPEIIDADRKQYVTVLARKDEVRGSGHVAS